MKNGPWPLLFVLLSLGLFQAGRQILPGNSAQGSDKQSVNENLPTTIIEARARARLLHETVGGTLQVVHRDFFRGEESLAIPSKSLEDVFQEVARTHKVELRWLAVDTKAMDVDHEPKSEFDHAAVEALKTGKSEFELVTAENYQFAGPIRLSSRCLKCHLPLRSSNDDRTAALVICMPVGTP